MAHKKTAIKHRPFLFFPRTMSSLVKKEKQEPELPATPTQTSWGEGEVGFAQCRLGQEEESSGFRVPCTKAEKCGFDSPLDKAWHVLLYNMRLREDKYDLVAGHPRAWLCIWPRLTTR